MKLLRIEMCGFKSFAEPVVFEIGAGVTAFVGPNGCGKSNIVDAIRWGLGEQSAKSLRGKEMLDVIFNGSQGHPAAGAAEVTLAFDNSDGKLPVPHAEISVTRRLLRSGESEYLVNKQPCRLRDIRELFWDTGVGVQAYSVIEQGKVDLLLHASAQERREIFEEAAGISRYRAKVHLAASRLERVDQNLARIRDLVKELDRQLRSIRRQAARARKARAMQEEYKSLKIQWYLHRYAQGSAEAETCRRQEEELTLALARQREHLESLEREAESAQQERSVLDGALQEIRFQVERIDQEAEALSVRASDQQERSGQIARQIEELSGQIEQLRALGRSAREALTASEEQTQTLAARQAAAQKALGAQEEEARGVQEQVAGVLGAQRDRQDLEMEAVRRRIQREGERVALTREREGLLARARRHGEKAGTLAGTSAHGREQVDAAAARMEALGAGRQRLAAKEQYYRGEAERFLAEEEAMRAQAEVLRYRLTQAESQRGAIQDQEREIQGICAGKSLGRLLDFLRAPAGFAHAIESALGRHGTDWVVEDLDGALSIVDRADGRRLSGLGVFPLDRAASPAGGEQRSLCQDGVIGWAAPLVESADSVQPVVRALLSDTLIVEDRRAALALMAGGRTASRLVTLSGELYEPSGAIQYVGEEEGLGPTARHVTGARLQKEILRVSALIEQAEAHRAEVRARREEALRIQRETGDAVASIDRQIAQARLELEQVRAAATQLDRELELCRAESQAAAQEAELLTGRIAALAPEREEPAPVPIADPSGRREASDLQVRWEACQQALTRLRLEAEEARRLLADNALSRERSRQDEERWGSEEKRLSETCRALERQIARDRAEAEEFLARAKTAREGRPAMEGRLAGAQEALRTHEEGSRRRREALGSARQAEREAEARLNERKLAGREISLRMAGEADRAREDFQVQLAELACAYVDEPREWDAVQARCEELKRELERVGGVDLEALSEEEEIERRHSFLAAQEEDLSRAREALTNLVRNTNRVSRERFQETFQKIRENFQEAFRKLFGGGKADILLEEGADLLEAGIEIVARPPGKEPQSIGLLSGGEKSMTAVALLFAVFQSRPSPFCILDEADAALDERNIDRFVQIVREFLAHSQFLIITHNKRTMRVADRLYGVTQQEPGISVPIPLKFEEVLRTPAGLGPQQQPSS